MNTRTFVKSLAACGLISSLLATSACKTSRSDAADEASAPTPKPSKSMSNYGVTSAPFGKTPEGQEVEVFTLVNKSGVVARIMTYGATLTELHVPDRNGNMGDILLGFDNLEQYMKESPYFGCTTGRYANRIAKGQFTLDGKTYKLATNNDPNHLHGGNKGLDKRVWSAVAAMRPEGPSVRFSYTSPDGEEGYPGTLWMVVTYILTNDNELTIEYEAKTDQATPINLTNHAYFNLKDGGASSNHGHMLQINADYYTPVDATMIPTGESATVKGTPMDFTTPTAIGARIAQVGTDPKGYDHNYVLRPGKESAMRKIVTVYEPTTGRAMDISTTEPGVQFYSGNFLDGTLTGKYGNVYEYQNAFCLETQHFPDSPNQPKFPSVILRPGETYRHITTHKFYTR